jgi:hypothetical protein
VVPDTDAFFATSWLGTVVARAGKGIDDDRAGADKSQWQCVVRQQSIGCDPAWWHCAVAGSHHSARVGKLPMSETANSSVTTNKALRISYKHYADNGSVSRNRHARGVARVAFRLGFTRVNERVP